MEIGMCGICGQPHHSGPCEFIEFKMGLQIAENSCATVDEDEPQPSLGNQSGDGLKLLRYSKLRTAQLKYLNLQRAKGIRAVRRTIAEMQNKGIEPAQLPSLPEIRSRSILVRHLRHEFQEPTHCKWCEEALTAESLALTFDRRLEEGGSAEIENVVAICKQCFFHMGAFPQWFWAKLVGWLKEEGLLDVYRTHAATWARKAAYRKHWAAKYAKGRNKF
jgi:hypothetical protein